MKNHENKNKHLNHSTI